MMYDKTYTIGEMVAKGKVSIRTLRYYDQIDLLKPTAYSEGGHRLYSNGDLDQLSAIQALKNIGFSLKEIKDIQNSGHLQGKEVHRTLQYQRKVLAAKQRTIEDMIKDIDHMLRITDPDKEINADIFCSMVHYITNAEARMEWLEEEKISADEDEVLEKEWTIVLSDLKKVIRSQISPDAPIVQDMIGKLLEVIKRTAGDSRETGLPSSKPPVLAPFSEKEQQYLKQAIRIYKE
ncbi:MerR family transcriptional regulator [Terribacillus saccharophilus]|uniref:HTH merR-type domain-containing protein n=1 Tax=Terribacillus saccharophilus TaxID=361277 RepID=A0ABX4GZ92_9BACI|nr:MerR family transcriptional regulator [Terribacillus saccharophilus]PAD35652.1 hypothetical protein CHH56_08070 [Terribacillus saccharophilus]PAD96625.1 hypothetical protein CHH50_08490 [Terribacillus saccharophilus]PAE00201.1 hypothetical protein CHH48_09395 [Terribacillus saccharophilus]